MSIPKESPAKRRPLMFFRHDRRRTRRHRRHLIEAGRLTIGPDDVGTETFTLTPAGAQVARQLAMGEATFNAILDAVDAAKR